MEDVGRVGLVSPSMTSGPPQVWAMASGKGGVGRSFLTANLGHLLARDIGPVTLLDLDFNGANLHTFLGEQATRGGVEAFLRGGVPSLAGVVKHLAIPGLDFVPGPLETPQRVTARECTRLIRAVRRLETPWTLLDLPGDAGRTVLDLFMAADRPVIVVVPEPAAVENAHRFIKRVYVRVLDNRLRAAAIRGEEREELLHAAAAQPPERLLKRLEDLETGLGEHLRHDLEMTTLYLIVNQVRHRSDEATGLSIKNAVQSYFGISVCHVGAVPFDEEAWLSARRRHLHTREAVGDDLAVHLEQVLASLVEGVELVSARQATPRVQLL